MDRLPGRHVDRIMLALLIASTAAATPPQVQAAVDLCRPVLARRAGGKIASIDVTKFTIGRKEIALRGRVTVFAGMTAPAPGFASAHHLVRTQFSYRCTVKRSKVHSASLAPLR